MLLIGAVDPSILEADTVSWMVRPKSLRPGTQATLSYNAKSGPLAFIEFSGDKAPTLKGGFNGWNGAFEKVMRRSSSKVC